MRALTVVLVALATLAALICAAPPEAMAQPIGLPVMPGHTPPDAKLRGLTFFMSSDAGLTPYIATYTGSGYAESLIGSDIIGADTSFEFEEREQRLLYLGGTVGARYAFVSTLVATVGFGVSYLQLQEQNLVTAPGGSLYDNQHDEFRTIKPNPGFSALLGLDWEALHTSHISVVLGLQTLYRSAFGLSGASLDGTDTAYGGGSDGDRLEYTVTNTTDLSFHLFTIQPHAGLQWRPVGSLVVNSFGVFSAITLSAGKMTKRVRTASEFFPGDGTPGGANLSDSKIELDMNMDPIQIMGGYYGWYFAIPHFGTLGLEAQFGARWNAELSYQYTF